MPDASASTLRLPWWRRLYVRIYLAVLLSLWASVAIFAWLAEWHAAQPRFHPNLEIFAEIAARALPPADAQKIQHYTALQHMHRQVRAHLALYAADGSLIAAAGRPIILSDGWRQGESRWFATRPPTFILKMPDGRWLVGQHQRPPGPAPKRILHVLLIAALVIALGAYPVIRHLTRKLERLQSSVDSWGRAQLSARVEVEGNDEVARLAHSFNQAAGRIEDLVAAQKNLLANASHELRSPLARIRMALELIDPHAPPAVQQELRRNLQELDQLIGEILLTSRLDAQTQVSNVENIDCIGLLAEECARVDAQLEIAESSQAELQGDARLIRRMLRNLLENARRHGAKLGTAQEDGQEERSGEILASLRSEADYILIDICDRGPGVPEAEREHIFEPFYRLPGAREADGGVGLGLALVRQIAQRHGGSVCCLAREGGGSCFHLRLPKKHSQSV